MKRLFTLLLVICSVATLMAQRPQDFMRVGGGISPDLILQDDGNHLQNLPQRNVMSDPETTVPVTLTVATEKYGQLEEQLKDYADVWSDSIVVSGFMNKADFSGTNRNPGAFVKTERIEC
ncbi:MAG: hypothetical protein OSJ56_13770, partial [Prevotella sp.]|nr:hypothetical protein [Prevotella sp.]